MALDALRLEKALDEVVELLRDIAEHREVSVAQANFKLPDVIKTRGEADIGEKKFELANVEEVTKRLESIALAIKENRVDEVQVANFPKIPKTDLKGLERQLQTATSLLKRIASKDLSVEVKAPEIGEVFVKNRNPDEAISVRLTEKEGKRFYDAIGGIIAAAGSAGSTDMTNTNTKLDTIAGYLDTVETKLQSIIDNTDTLELKAETINLNTDTLETLIGATNTALAGTLTATITGELPTGDNVIGATAINSGDFALGDGAGNTTRFPQTTGGSIINFRSYGYVFNGTTWDRMPGGTNGLFAQGNVASGATDAGNPVKVGGVYNSTKPTLTTGQRADLQLGSRGNLRVELVSADSATNISAATPGDAASAQNSLYVKSHLSVFNGTTWDRIRSWGTDGNNTGLLGAGIYGRVPVSGNANMVGMVSDSTDGNSTQGVRLLAAGSYLYGYNGTTWDRLRSDTTNGLDVDVTRVSGTVTVDGSGVTQPVSAASLPLPTGASTSAKQDTIIGHLDGVEGLLSDIDAGKLEEATFTGRVGEVQATPTANTVLARLKDINDSLGSLTVTVGEIEVKNDTGNPVPVSAASLPLPTGAATSANQSTIIGHVDGIEGLLTTIDADTGTIAGAVAGTEMQVDVVTSALPTGAATAANQSTANTSLSAIEGYLDTVETKLQSLIDQTSDLEANQTSDLTEQRIKTGAMALRVDVVCGGFKYKGWAEPGTATSAASWRVRRITQSGDDVTIEFADGNRTFDNIWDNRASLTYS